MTISRCACLPQAGAEAGARRLRDRKRQCGLTLSFQQAEGRGQPGQATAQKEKGKLR